MYCGFIYSVYGCGHAQCTCGGQRASLFSLSNNISPGDHTEVVEVSRRTFTLAGLLFSITAFLSKKNEKALLTLKFLLLYSLRVVCKMAVTCVLSFGRQESLVVTAAWQPGARHGAL